MQDTYVSQDPCAFIDETDTWSSDDSVQEVQEHLETRDESIELPTGTCSEMSPARKLWYALKSLASWREKARVKQERIRVLEQRVRDLTESRANWKKKASQAEKQINVHAVSGDQTAQTKSSLKLNTILRRE